jgi:hypothetical protein
MMESRTCLSLYRFLSCLILIGALSTSCVKRDEPDPILLLATQNNFGLYTGEILTTEGFNSFDTDSITNPGLTINRLEDFDIVILAETSITSAQCELLTQYVEGGGNLIAFRPDRRLSEVFGLVGGHGEIVEAYLSIHAGNEIANGITNETLQFHGTADQYTLKDGLEIARLFKDDTTATDFPAVVMNKYGKGQTLAFLYNLPKSIVYTRQGNPRDAGKEMDGITGIRAMDLFTNGYVNTSKNVLNQADEQMRLLSHGIEQMSLRTKPLPRFWYFPDTLRCLVTLNNDGEDSKEIEFGPQFEDVAAKEAKMTLYIKEVEYISKDWVDSWAKKGFEFSGHPDDTRQATNPDWNTMDSVYKALQRELESNYGITNMQTVTNHWFVWVGNNQNGEMNFAAQAKIENNNGVGLDCNYAHYDNGSTQGHFLGELGTNQGNYTGSGLSMKFADASGEVIHVYQQLNNVYDQQYMEHKDQDGYYNAFKGLMDRSLNKEVYSTISIRAHNNEYFFSKVPLMKMLDYARSKGIPVWTELQFYDFLMTKEEASFGDLRWSGNKLTFTIHSVIPHQHGITCMIPYSYNGKKITEIISNGVPQSYTINTVKGFEYAWVTIKPGARYMIEVSYAD